MVSSQPLYQPLWGTSHRGRWFCMGGVGDLCSGFAKNLHQILTISQRTTGPECFEWSVIAHNPLSLVLLFVIAAHSVVPCIACAVNTSIFYPEYRLKSLILPWVKGWVLFSLTWQKSTQTDKLNISGAVKKRPDGHWKDSNCCRLTRWHVYRSGAIFMENGEVTASVRHVKVDNKSAAWQPLKQTL